jgi:hypothetical protein
MRAVSRGGHRDDDPGTNLSGGTRAADQLLDGLGPRPGELSEQLAAAAKQRPEQARERQHDVAVCDGGEHVLAQPRGPEELLLLLA